MAKNYRYRFIILVSGLAIMASLALVGVQQSWRRFSTLERRLTTSMFESFRLSDDFQTRVRGLNHTVLRFAARGEPGLLTEFQHNSQALKRWIDLHDPQTNRASDLGTEAERLLFRRIYPVYDEYLQAANGVLVNYKTGAPPSQAYGELDRFETQSQRLILLASELAEAHQRAKEAFLADANGALAALRVVMIAAISVMIFLVGALGVAVYRDLIAPLRVRLGQSEALRERQEKLATLGTLAAGIAHEIRNPLTSIKARLYTLDRHIRGNSAGLADANMIGEEIGRLERIVQDVLSFARPSEPKRAVVRAETVLREVHLLMAAALEKTRVYLELEPAEEVLVSMDRALIKQVLINLIRNAADAMVSGGTVTLRVRSDRVPRKNAPFGVALLDVVDTGNGISAEAEKRLFDPFFTTKEAGTGLGLSIALRIVEKSGGSLQYKTQIGRGTTFTIVLPCAGADTDMQRALQPQSPVA